MSEKGLKFLRFLILVSSISPVFVLLAIKGSNFNNEILNSYFRNTLFILAAISFLPLLSRYLIAKDKIITKKIEKDIKPCSEEYSTYILSIALPLCQNSISNENDLIFLLSLLFFIFVVFYIFNLYYLNIFFYLLGYNLYKISSKKEHDFVIITKKELQEIISKELRTIHLTNSLFLERDS